MDRGNHKKTDSVNKTLKEEKLTVFSGDSETKPLIFTFVPTIRRLPTHSQVADATKYLVKIGEEPRDKSHGAINRSNSNEFLDCVTLKSGIQQESDIQTYACSTETSPKIIQGRGLKLNQPETMQQSDLFKAEYVFIVDSEGEEEATGRKEDKQPTVGNGHGLARPKSLALAPGPITTLQKPHQGDFQGPPQSDLPQDAASPQKQIQLTSSPSTTSDQLSCKPPALFVSPTNLKAQSDMVSLHQASILEEFHTRRVDPRGSSMQETSTYFQRTTHSSPCFAPAEVTLEQKSTQILDSKQLKNMSSPTLAHQKAGLWSETLNKNSTSPSHFISSSGSQSFTAEVPGSSAPKSDASSYIPVRIITHSLSPSPKPLNPTFYGSSSTLCSQASSSGNLAKSGAKSPVPTRLSLLTAILKSNPPHGRPFSPVSCPTFSSNSLTSSTLTLDQRVKRTPPTPKKSYSSFSLKEESPDLGEHQPTDISQQSVHSPLFTKIASQEASLSYKKPLSSSPLTPQLEKAPPSPVSPKRTMIPPQLQSKILNSSILPPIPPCSSAVSFKKGNHDADPKGLAPEKSKRVHTYSSTSSSSVFVSDTASQGNILPFPKEYLSPTSPFYPTCQSQVASSQLLSKEKNFVSAITPSISIPSSLSHSSLGSSIPLIDNIHSHTIHSISSLHPNDQFSTLPIRPAKSPEATVMHTRSPVSSTAPPMSLTRAKESTSTQSLSLPSDPENKKTKQYKIKSSYKAFAAIPTNTLLLEQKANLTSPSSTMAVSQLTKPGVIRPVPAKSKIILRKEEEETYEPNPFSKYLEDTSGLFAGQDVTSLHDATPLHPLYKTKPFPPAKSLLYPQNLSYTDCLTPGPFSHLSSVSLGDGHVNSPTSFSHNRLYNKPSHPIVTIPENEALDSKEVLQHKLRELHESGAAVQAGPLDFSLHDLNPGDKVYIKNFKRTGATQPSWEGPFQILLTTPTSIKIGERDSWIHCSHVKKASSAETD
ncbi:muscular LMNA-interacting protein isoform X11 [Monodelphis domestica]|uniref:muscular LMNA-interacting protein isoform X11 n=1 Tax=Monodelphis domestica TaxID=13616 RepID=UPI0024E225B7|nr:muscular LMNA-interacting protein isoform X11 [Monodelphis domestica]